MIGFFDYSTWLTYLSLISATIGIAFSLHDMGHPYWGMFFLLFSGFCDAFDGRVARRKKDRTDIQKKFGIQIDSLADLVAFGVLPACIGQSLATLGPFISGVERFTFRGEKSQLILSIIVGGIMIFFVLAAMIRLAYFNVIEEERQKKEAGTRKSYLGLPVTSSALIFPTILLLQYVLPMDITIIYYLFLLITGMLFLSKINVPKPQFKHIMVMVSIGAIEGILLLLGLMLVKPLY